MTTSALSMEHLAVPAGKAPATTATNGSPDLSSDSHQVEPAVDQDRDVAFATGGSDSSGNGYPDTRTSVLLVDEEAGADAPVPAANNHDDAYAIPLFPNVKNRDQEICAVLSGAARIFSKPASGPNKHNATL